MVQYREDVRWIDSGLWKPKNWKHEFIADIDPDEHLGPYHCEEMHLWLKENCRAEFSFSEAVRRILLNNDDDAFAFKMRWS